MAYIVNNITIEEGLTGQTAMFSGQVTAQSFVGDGAGLTNVVGLIGPTGPTGTQGLTGPTGPANTLTIGTVTGGDTADASITGTSPNQILNLTLPRGATGPTGAVGPAINYGATSATGTLTTSSTGDVVITNMQFTGLTAGVYAFSFYTSLSNTSNNSSIWISIYANGTKVGRSEVQWARSGSASTTPISIPNFVVALGVTSTVDVRWRTDLGTANSLLSRNFSYLKVG